MDIGLLRFSKSDRYRLLPGYSAVGQEQDVFNALGVGVFICDRTGVMHRYNAAAATLCRRRGKEVSDAADSGSAEQDRALRLFGRPESPVNELISQVLQTARALRGVPVRLPRSEKHGGEILTSIDAIKDEGGRVTGAVGTILETRRVDHSADRRTVSEVLLNASPIPIIAIDRFGMIIWANGTAHQYFCQFVDLVGRGISDVFPSPELDAALKGRILNGHSLLGEQIAVDAPPFSKTHVSFSCLPVFVDGHFVGAVCQLADMSAPSAEADQPLHRQGEGGGNTPRLWRPPHMTDKRTVRGSVQYPTPPYGDAASISPTRGIDCTQFLWSSDPSIPQGHLLPAAPDHSDRPASGLWHDRPASHSRQMYTGAAGMTHRFDGPMDPAVVHIEGRLAHKADAMAQQLAAIVENSNDGIISMDLDGIIQSWNSGASRLFGYAADEVLGKAVHLLIPPDRHDEEEIILARVRRNEPLTHYETVRKRRDGRLIDVALTVSPVRDASGNIIGASKVARDITHLKREADRHSLMLREMGHRMKNIFAVASSLVGLSARTASSSSEMASSAQQRLNALSRAYELTCLMEESTPYPGVTDVDLSDLLRAILAPFADSDRASSDYPVAIHGPRLRIASKCITNLTLLFHELATNATKYGALSRLGGHITIRYAQQHGQLTLEWRERGGPALDPDSVGAGGFGDLLMRGVVQAQLGGDYTRAWHSDGLALTLSLPLSALLPATLVKR